jgi:hypothetical protein
MTKEKILWRGALQYHIGRMKYEVSEFADLVEQEWHNLPEEIKAMIKQEVERAFYYDCRDRMAKDNWDLPKLGDDLDRDEWMRIRKLWK